MDPTIWHWTHWAGFAAFVVIALVVDLFVFHRDAHEPSLRESSVFTVAWCFLALVFNGLVWFWARQAADAGTLSRHANPAMEFLIGYLVEWSLSMDNVFVFAVIFAFFRVPLKYQYRVLFWGILGAVVMRLSFILVGAAVLKMLSWAIAVFGILLIYTAVKLAISHESDMNPEKNLVLRLARRWLRVAKEPHGDKFFVVEHGKRCVTPLFLVLLVVESVDVMFAVDSVPAILGITQDQFIVFTSNTFAILGLRALYFLLAGVMDMFRYLKYGLSGVLGFVGTKMIADWTAKNREWIDPDGHLIPHWASLLVIVALLAISIGASMLAKWLHPHSKASQPGLDTPPPR